MVKLLKQSSISLHFEKHKGGQRVDYKGWQNADPVNDIQTKISKPDQNEDNIFLETEDDRTYGERVDDRLEAGYRELNDSERHSQDGWKQRYNSGRYHQGKRKCKSRR